MTLSLCTLSHAPLFGVSDPGKETYDQVDAAFKEMRDHIATFDPELVLVYGPDHYNGVFYDMMPPFCIGSRATAVGDWGTEAGPLPVDRDVARLLVAEVLRAGLDVAQSEDLIIDHGIAQPMEFLFGKHYSVPVVPVFINAVGLPLGPIQRIRLLGEAIGTALVKLDRRVLVLGSGGLSHDPPVPRLEESPPEVVARLIDGRNPSTELREAREKRIIAAAHQHAYGEKTAQDINPAFDASIMRTLAEGDFGAVDGWTNEWFVREGGHSAHEIRTWVAAYSTMAAAGPFEVTASHYWPVEEWMTGFGMTIATTR